METNSFWLSLMIFLPIIGAVSLFCFPKSEKEHVYHWLAAFWTGTTFVASLFIFSNYQNSLHFDATKPAFQFIDRLSWIPQFNIHYQVGVDGLSMPMVLLTTLILFMAVFTSWNIKKNPRLYFFMLLIMETGVLGVFTSLDLFLFFVMWELELIPMFFLIGLWGGKRREYAAIKFVIYTMVASAFMLAGFLCIYFLSNIQTFDVIVLLNKHQQILAQMTPGFQLGVFLFLFFAFAVKLPMVPFHTWLPDAHVQAPTAISVVLAGVLLKMGAYGIIRFNFSFFPDIARDLGAWLAIFGMINIIYGAFLALNQKDMKGVIAYSSVSHMGFVLLGLASMNTIGFNGAILQMFTHGTITALLFIFVGVVYDRTQTRDIEALGGLSEKMPLASALFVLAAMASVGAPGLSGFVSEFLIFTGTYGNELTGISHYITQICTVIAALGIILSAGYMLWLTQRVFFGELPERWKDLTDLNEVELLNITVLTLLVVIIGLYPALITDYINPASEQLISIIFSKGV